MVSLNSKEKFFEWKLTGENLLYLSAIITGVAYGGNVEEFKEEAKDLFKSLYIQTHKE